MHKWIIEEIKKKLRNFLKQMKMKTRHIQICWLHLEILMMNLKDYRNQNKPNPRLAADKSQ